MSPALITALDHWLIEARNTKYYVSLLDQCFIFQQIIEDAKFYVKEWRQQQFERWNSKVEKITSMQSKYHIPKMKMLRYILKQFSKATTNKNMIKTEQWNICKLIYTINSNEKGIGMKRSPNELKITYFLLLCQYFMVQAFYLNLPWLPKICNVKAFISWNKQLKCD